MDFGDEDRSLRRIVLRFLNEDEDQAGRELDDIIRAVSEHIGRESSIYTWAVPALLIIPPLLLLAYLVVSLISKTAGNLLFGAAQLSCLIPLYFLWKWGRFQYGSGRLWKPRDALYVNASDDTKEALEKFFTYLRREGGPKTYYRDRKGEKRYLERRHFFGSLRVLLLSEFGAIRALCLSPDGRRISETIRVDADPDEIINALQIRPKRAGGPGRYVKYPYSDAIISLIGDDQLAALDLTDERAAIAVIKRHLSQWFEDHADESGDVPRGDLLAPYARKVYRRLKMVGVRAEP
ncbi:MAG: hypothetical protein ACT6Q5_00495 [Sphingopyxis solisilvae]|uniref:hypothetical protein n=1 Tax=Sphingopyxis solisilvae TaxID=1886788 RepID=UPI0040367447